MKRVAAGAHLPTSGFLSLRNVQTIVPTTIGVVSHKISANDSLYRQDTQTIAF